jgi:protein ImuA
MANAASARLIALEAMAGSLPVWRGQELAHQAGRVLPSGHAALDAELPGGGWPLDGMTELLLRDARTPFWQLLLPALAACVQQAAGPVVLVAPPHVPFAPSLAAQGLPGERLLWLCASRESQSPAQRLWAAEQALKCADVVAVLAWLPQANDAQLRRLQMAMQADVQRPRPLFVLRDARAARTGSPARLRLQLQATAAAPSLDVQIVKRRGPPLAQPLRMRAQARALQALLASRKGATSMCVDIDAMAADVSGLSAVAGGGHALDRAAA